MADSREKRKWRSSLTTNKVTVTISVDDCGTTEKQTFTLHRGLLCSHSPYFYNAFKGGFRESEEKTIHLPDVTASTMRIFQSWVYGQVSRSEPGRRSKKAKHNPEASKDGLNETMESTQTVEDEIKVRTPTSLAAWAGTGAELIFKEKHHFVQHMSRLYAFGEVYNTPQLCRDAMTVLVELTNVNWIRRKVAQRDFVKASRELFDALPSTSPICQYMIHKMSADFAWTSEITWMLEMLSGSAVLFDLVLGLGRLRGDRNELKKIRTVIINACSYHQHSTPGEVEDCRESQLLDGTFYSSLARACMNEVYEVEDDAHAENHGSTTMRIDENLSFNDIVR